MATKKQKEELKKLEATLIESKNIADRIRKSEAKKFINTPVQFERQSVNHDEYSTRLSDVSMFLEDCIEHLNELNKL